MPRLRTVACPGTGAMQRARSPEPRRAAAPAPRAYASSTWRSLGGRRKLWRILGVLLPLWVVLWIPLNVGLGQSLLEVERLLSHPEVVVQQRRRDVPDGAEQRLAG